MTTLDVSKIERAQNASPSFASYAPAFEAISGMFSLDAALLMAAWNQLTNEAGIAGDTLEIGVHHGLSAILVAGLRKPGGRFVAVDLFESLQRENLSRSGSGDRAKFSANMRRFYADDGFVDVFACASSRLSAKKLGRRFSFCHIDGGHSAEETFSDLALCAEVALPGALVVLDDYFNCNFPGVCEGAVKFSLQHPGVLIPLATGFNKVIFQRAGAANRLQNDFEARFGFLPHIRVVLWGRPALLFGSSITSFFDLEQSSFERLVRSQEARITAALNVEMDEYRGAPGKTVHIPVTVRNTSSMPFAFGSTPIGLSYHLLSCSGEVLIHDNPRNYFYDPLRPGETRTVPVPVSCPAKRGDYQVEFDLVWEGICWFKENGNIAPVARLVVQ